MATRKTKKELTPEEALQAEKERCIASFNNDYSLYRAPDPTYHFNVGDVVRYGSMVSSTVEEIHNDGRCYLLKCIARNNNYGKPYEYETYRAVAWHQIRPIKENDTNFATNQDIRIYFNNSTIESLIHKHYHFGIDMEPDYQRGYVWEMCDKEALLDSIFENVDIGKFVLIRLDSEQWSTRDVMYEILDGKQRLSTLIEYYENRFPYNGKYFNDLSGLDRYTLMQHTISVGEVDNANKKEVYNYFLMLNKTGRPMAKEQIEKVEKLLAES